MLLRREPHILAVGHRAASPQFLQGSDQRRHLRVSMHRGWRQPHALGATRHRWVIDRLHVNSVMLEQRVGHRLAVHGVADHHRHDVARVLHHRKARRGELSLECLHALLQVRALDIARPQVPDAGERAGDDGGSK